jgi:hypothetical protein
MCVMCVAMLCVTSVIRVEIEIVIVIEIERSRLVSPTPALNVPSMPNPRRPRRHPRPRRLLL